MKKYFLSFIFLSLIIIIIASCTKNSTSNTPATCTLNDTSIIGNYKVTDAHLISYPAIPGLSGDVFTNPLLSSYYPPCRRDDIISLNAGGIYIYTDAGDTCSTKDNAEGTWSLKSDTLITTTLGQKDTAVISNFGCSTAILNYNNFEGTGAQVNLTITRQ